MNDKEMYEDGVSVVIVTYNGSQKLLPTLTYLSKQKNIVFNFEVLLVDNNSNDGTSKKAQEIWTSLGAPFKLRIVSEKMPGTMFARKKGIDESMYRYILYCDDDNWFCSDYVVNAYNIIKESDSIAAVGGKGIIEFEKGIKIPSWFAPYEKNYGTGAQGKKDGDTTNDKGCLYTAGAIIDKIWLQKLYSKGFKSVLKGRDGKSLVAGEDTELTYALRIIGGKLYYSSKMTFKHFMPSNRINWKYLKKLWFTFGIGGFVLSPYNNYFANKDNPKSLKLFKHYSKIVLVLAIKLLLAKKYDGDIRQLEFVKNKGQLKALLFLNKKRKQSIKMTKQLAN